jgi:hypothetical protein
MTNFLTLKHWQLFGLLLGFPIVLQLIAFGFVISSNDPSTIFYLFPMVMILFSGTFFGWLYALGTNLHKKLPSTVTMNLTRFKILLLIPFIYISFISILISGMFESLVAIAETDIIIFVLIGLHLFSMFCVFYCLYFNAKALKTVESQQLVTFSDFIGEFFVIWFFPIGIWILQPRINKLFDKTLIFDIFKNNYTHKNTN